MHFRQSPFCRFTARRTIAFAQQFRSMCRRPAGVPWGTQPRQPSSVSSLTVEGECLDVVVPLGSALLCAMQLCYVPIGSALSRGKLVGVPRRCRPPAKMCLYGPAHEARVARGRLCLFAMTMTRSDTHDRMFDEVQTSKGFCANRRVGTVHVRSPIANSIAPAPMQTRALMPPCNWSAASFLSRYWCWSRFGFCGGSCPRLHGLVYSRLQLGLYASG
jgi:hypothetical protein